MATKPVTKKSQNNTVIKVCQIIYILYLVSILVGLTYIVGGICAYVYRDDATTVVTRSHIEFQIQSFWKGIVIFIIAFILSFFVVGVLVYIYLIIWILIRNIKGLKAICENKEIKNIKNWCF